ncbi:MAG: tetratricopeptide repeat protein [Planctomycetota bacterium]|jgi:hypothetical protein
MSQIRRFGRRGLIVVAAFATLMLSAEAIAGGCAPRRGYYRTTHFTNGYYHGPYNYYPSRRYRSSRYYPSRYRHHHYSRYRNRDCGPYGYGYGYTYFRRPLRYAGYASFPVRDVRYVCSSCGGYGCSSTCGEPGPGERGRAVRSAVPPASVMVISSADRKAARDPAVVAATWKMLEDGNPHEALLDFTRLATAAPKSAQPKLGYGLSAALTGDDYNAQWAIRRALLVDPDGVREFRASPALLEQLRGLASRYDARESSEQTADSQFLAASVQYLLREYDDAQVTLEPVLASGDRQRSTMALRDLVEAQRSVIGTETLVQAPATDSPAPEKTTEETPAQLASSRGGK